MTVAISLKVNDGLVLSADSASTFVTSSDDGSLSVENVYNNANKVFTLRKGLPIGAITWGAGSIGSASISTLAKDLRQRLSDESDARSLDPDSYTVEDVGNKVREFMYDEHYVPAFESREQKPLLGFVVAGYSAGESMSEEYSFIIAEDGSASPLTPLRPKEQSGITWNGQTEAIARLLLGFAPQLSVVLHENLGVPEDQVPQAMEIIREALAIPMIPPAMPMQDAIDFSHFLVDLSIKVSRFAPGAPTVGGPIEIAAISKHEGFKWIRRKHYFKQEFNPEVKA